MSGLESEARFLIGGQVALRADRTRRGAVIEVLPSGPSLPTRYRVFHSPTEQYIYDESQLILDVVDDTSPSNGHVSPEDFRARLTAARLAHPQVDTLYAMQAARIKFIPFQMKPLLRFLKADQPRLLIADEVGVGKTIEAGLILKEMETRQRVDNVLIVCPKALTTKWRTEMRRFDEDFEILASETLRYCLDQSNLEGEWPSRYARSIVHLELLRTANYLDGTDGKRPRPGLRALDPAPQFDLIIVDEAHHVRNPGTNSYDVAQALCEMSDAVIFLSATPVQIGSSNLFALLNLLRPDLFPDFSVFDAVIEPNQYVTAAMRHVQTRAPADSWQLDAYMALQQAAATEWGSRVLRSDPRFAEWFKLLGSAGIETEWERIRCLRDLQEMHSLAQIMNRTRRRDIDRFTLRDPHTVSVPFTPSQKEFYEELVEFRREIFAQKFDYRVAGLITDTLERQAASCLPAMLPALDRLLATGTLDLAELSDDPDIEEGEEVHASGDLLTRARRVRALAEALPAEDPKLDQLMFIVDESLAPDTPGKVLIFSFFLHTLGYLLKHLRGAGYRVELISGQVPDETREELRDRFRLDRSDPRALDVLLSSEVGCEGLDYEFCDRMVNYDIPWNPMRVEQRIGRIDRFGQKAEKVLIFNFITPGTVEERIFFRCFERLGVFRDTVGDLEEVLGDVVQDLTRAAMNPTLTPEQAEIKAHQTANNALLLMEEQLRLEQESSGLLGLDQAFMDELDEAQRLGKFVSATDVRLMVEQYLDLPRVHGKIVPEASVPEMYRLTLHKEGRGELYSEIKRQYPRGRQSRQLMEWLAGNTPFLRITFHQATALEHRDVTFITPVHPLAKLARDHSQSQGAKLSAHLIVRDESLPEGRYAFVCDLWEAVAIHPEVRMVSLAYDLDRDEVAEGVSERLLRLFESATEGDGRFAGEAETVISQRLEEALYARRSEELKRLREQNGVLVERRLTSIDAYYRNRMHQVQERLSTATNDRIRRMLEAQLRRLGTEYMEKRKELGERRQADIVPSRLATGTLEVRHGE